MTFTLLYSYESFGVHVIVAVFDFWMQFTDATSRAYGDFELNGATLHQMYKAK